MELTPERTLPLQGSDLCPMKNGAFRRRKCLIFLVGGAGFEPATPAV